ncbi:peptide-methionine (S)-S-oxide reductase MsrA [Companilactobacillus sp.]|jgi:peptide-methionine (S)-S-oxide reductase|uniref:peptide-methionine (S)-S-oxide reductase MsrA n=1 Tax=Companilactobacillus sp. TaxID=2767905 RepID=UPI0025C4B815|nr:peptide-methionine (S)-S-oxide reductase MsrA [Companilactobacillus sp.]MCH4008211.1 peptide-methionine (S)-S-oxide reductase MsrA [Companilactobacillus sp.]MCH4051610.1 peptide-methionine (S)-S-oxide reductase MsrA [Companilactobacillus sp.]MCH4076154.1 peptide-methionine (S)-S-oxide reductase MsrA [Companilactobacillus sp.]MCH4124729.1 peptide-methionine (S)-S-oxide reductase MsrA [Companilactobacillus sp.]MCH4131271.1 peptide-methionine (S)-S-oxide reductase MsrA [Companilactobacillus sp
MNKQTAIFAGGCFWCMVHPFDQQPGIISVISGYTGGHVPNPTYEQVCTGTTGHTEAVEITFDADIISYQELVEVYWTVADPTDASGQFQDRGDSYRPVIYYADETQKEIAEKSKQDLANSGEYDEPIVTQILPAKEFYVAEDYHQDFYKKNPERFEMEESGGRAEFMKKHQK